MFAIQGQRLPACNSYEGAVRVWEKAIPIDGCKSRGLVNRRETDKLVHQCEGAIHFRFHRTDLVIWHDERTVTVGAHDSVSSRIFMERFLPRGLSALCHRGETFLRCNSGVYTSRGLTLTFTLGDNDHWCPDLTAVKTFVKWVIDRKKAAQVRKALKPWIEWRDTVKRLRGGVRAADLSNVTLDKQYQLLARLLEGDQACFPQAYKMSLLHSDGLVNRAIRYVGAAIEQSVPPGEFPPATSVFDIGGPKLSLPLSNL